MRNFKVLFPVWVFLLLITSSAHAQFLAVSTQEVLSWLQSKRKVTLVDTRLPEEYQAGHIPGAINIVPERMRLDAVLLPKDRATPIIFYCRGTG